MVWITDGEIEAMATDVEEHARAFLRERLERPRLAPEITQAASRRPDLAAEFDAAMKAEPFELPTALDAMRALAGA